MNSPLNNNTTKLEALLAKVNELPEAGELTPVLQNKTVTPTINKQTITADIGYDGLDTVTVNAMPTATQATPTIAVDSSGLITATSTQKGGFVTAGTKSATKQLTTQEAKTIIPTKSSQTAVAKDVYTTGVITVGAIPNEYITTTDATASADEIFEGKTAYTADGKVTGTFTIEDELTEQNDLISQISTLVATKANPQGGTDTSDATAIAGDILSGKTAYVQGSKVTGTIPSKAATTYTPTTSDQTIASGTYLTGTQTIVGDTNLKAENIANGVSIFGVTGTYEGSGAGSGTTVSTSNITLNYYSSSMMMITGIYYSKLSAEGIEYVACDTFDDWFSVNEILNNVVCNTNIVIMFEEAMASIEFSDNVVQSDGFFGGTYAFRVTDTNNGFITINNGY